MANGYPISAAAANYDAQNPYANRDPRLAKFLALYIRLNSTNVNFFLSMYLVVLYDYTLLYFYANKK